MQIKATVKTVVMSILTPLSCLFCVVEVVFRNRCFQLFRVFLVNLSNIPINCDYPCDVGTIPNNANDMLYIHHLKCVDFNEHCYHLTLSLSFRPVHQNGRISYHFREILQEAVLLLLYQALL